MTRLDVLAIHEWCVDASPDEWRNFNAMVASAAHQRRSNAVRWSRILRGAAKSRPRVMYDAFDSASDLVADIRLDLGDSPDSNSPRKGAN